METIRALLLRDKAVKAAVEKGLIKTTTSVLSTPPTTWMIRNGVKKLLKKLCRQRIYTCILPLRSIWLIPTRKPGQTERNVINS